MTGMVHLIGAGPGDPELLTLKAVRMLRESTAVVYDRLVSPEVLALAPERARRFCVGKAPGRHPIPQERINDLLVDLARRGFTVARLKGGDPFIFGRGFEEAMALNAAGVAWDAAPGVTAAQGCAAAAGVPLTHRGLAHSVRYVTGHCRADGPLDLDWAGLSDPQTTLVVYMGAATMARIATELIDRGLPPSTPVLAVSEGTTPRERRVLTRLDRAAADAAEMPSPLLFVVGRVAALYVDAPVEAFAAREAAHA
jgi:uroporphyrin-III C-methyltransferase